RSLTRKLRQRSLTRLLRRNIERIQTLLLDHAPRRTVALTLRFRFIAKGNRTATPHRSDPEQHKHNTHEQRTHTSQPPSLRTRATSSCRRCGLADREPWSRNLRSSPHKADRCRRRSCSPP